jgi:hypothetical protein
MAASITQTVSQRGSIERIDLAWTAHTDGTGTLTATDIYGTLVQVQFAPGSVTPTNLYDLTLTDANSVDVLAGYGANLSSTLSARRVPLVTAGDGTTLAPMPMVIAGNLTLNITNAGTSTTGTVTLYLKK